MNKQSSSIHPKTQVAIAGARGYSGTELLRILSRHPSFEVCGVLGSQNTSTVQDLLPEFISGEIKAPAVLDEKSLLKLKPAILFLATPADISMELAQKFISAGTSVIDLSGAFRIKDQTVFEKWYGHAHSQFTLVESAVYGLSPWNEVPMFSEKKPVLISNPGCYATSVLMALLPLIKSDVIDLNSIVIDAKSGTTGAGKKASEGGLFSEVAEEILPYRIGNHQHTPEITQSLKAISGKTVDFSFTPHLLAVKRGILSSIYLKPAKSKSDEAIFTEIQTAFEKSYGQYPLVTHGKVSNALLAFKNVVGTGRTHISYEVKTGRIYLFSVLDNLWKGAASQAVENANRLIGLKPHFHLSLKENT